ncbi:hypothetical protein ACFLTO_06405 [Chloroflexota bacterium]
MNINRSLAMGVVLLAVVAVVVGAVFVGQGISKTNQLKEAMRVEQVTLGIEGAELRDDVIDSLAEAQKAGDTIREHRRGIATDYEDLLGEGRFDPTNPQHLSYAQAMNLENYLYLAVVAFGLTQSVTANGAFMVIIGFALGGTGLALYRLSGRAS